jgi:predicted Zn-ribbon and HTH transcriptional regulator
MVIALVGIVIGILVVIALIIKLSKTHPYEVVRIAMHCKKCGQETRRSKCPKCEYQRFGV